MNATTHTSAVRELDRRTNDGIDVALLWNSLTDGVSVTVNDARSGEVFELQVAPSDALLAFHHPYVYANPEQVGHAFAA